jgi:hypothetical protein
MVVAIDAFQHLDSHPEESCDLPQIAAALHRPRCCGVPQNMRGDLTIEPGRLYGGGERLTHRSNGLAVPFDQRLLGDPEPFPTPQMLGG